MTNIDITMPIKRYKFACLCKIEAIVYKIIVIENITLYVWFFWYLGLIIVNDAIRYKLRIGIKLTNIIKNAFCLIFLILLACFQ
jgi:hypothetical protein